MKEYQIKSESKAAKKLGRLCAAAFLFGVEFGKNEMILNIKMMEELDDDYDDPFYVAYGNTKSNCEAKAILDSLVWGTNEIEFSDGLEARKKSNMLRHYIKIKEFDYILKLKKQGNKILIIKE